MEGAERYKVRLLTHNPEWLIEFQRVYTLLNRIWSENVLSIEHVGSTAIPSIPAKPVLDVAVMVRSLDLLGCDALTALGYENCGFQNEAKTRILFVLRGENQLSLHHIHIYQEGDPDFHKQVGFRDYLNTHPEAAQEYAALKEWLAAQFADNRSAYTKGKAEFIRNILGRLN